MWGGWVNPQQIQSIRSPNKSRRLVERASNLLIIDLTPMVQLEKRRKVDLYSWKTTWRENKDENGTQKM